MMLGFFLGEKKNLFSVVNTNSGLLFRCQWLYVLCRYEWVDIGMLDYDPSTKLYLVKRVNIVTELQACERETISRQSQRSDKTAKRKPQSGYRAELEEIHSESTPSPRAMSGSSSRGGSISPVPDAAAPASVDGMEAGGADETPELRKSPELQKTQKPTTGMAVSKQQGSPLQGVKMKRGGLESQDGAFHWVPRVRVMFAAENPKVFASRVAHAHMYR